MYLLNRNIGIINVLQFWYDVITSRIGNWILCIIAFVKTNHIYTSSGNSNIIFCVVRRTHRIINHTNTHMHTITRSHKKFSNLQESFLGWMKYAIKVKYNLWKIFHKVSNFFPVPFVYDINKLFCYQEHASLGETALYDTINVSTFIWNKCNQNF